MECQVMMIGDIKLAQAAGLDAGNKSAKKGGRGAWNEEDWNKSCEVFALVLYGVHSTTEGFTPNESFDPQFDADFRAGLIR
jgi:hypothetical protein